MAIRTILHFPDPRLRQKVKPIKKIDNEIQTLIEDMFETMYHANGVGLAATQIGIAKSLAVIDVTRDKSQLLVLINPEILSAENFESMQEGCLSVPGHYDTVKRPTKLKLRANDRKGNVYELEAEGLLAECIHHEVDHLHGKLYIDMLSEMKRNFINKKLAKHRRHCDTC